MNVRAMVKAAVLAALIALTEAAELRVGIIGAGANTQKYHIPLLQAIPGVRVTHVVNRSPESSERAARAFGIPHTPATWQELVENPHVDAVVVGTWPYTHAEMSIAALRHGKHVLCEARMAANAAEARAMLHALQKASDAHPGIVAQVVPSPLTLRWDATIRRLILQGFVGKLLAVDVRGASAAFADGDGAPLHWRHDRELSGDNIMMMGIFYEAMQRWVGDAAAVVAMGKVNVRSRQRAGANKPTPVSIPDHLDVLARLRDHDAQVHLQFSAVTGLAERTMEFWLHGTEGTIVLAPAAPDERQRLRGGRRGGALQPIDVPANETAAWRVEEEFVGAIRGVESVRLTTFEQGVRYMQFTDAVQRSLKSGRTEEVFTIDARELKQKQKQKQKQRSEL